MSEESLSTDVREETSPVSASADTASGDHGVSTAPETEEKQGDSRESDADAENGASKDAEPSGSSDEATLIDGHDELSPESRRRARMILAVAAVLAVVAFVMLYFIPPLSWTPQKEVRSNFRPVATVVHVEPGASAQHALSYAQLSSPIFYEMEVEQKTHYDKGDTRVIIRAEVEIKVPERRDTDDTVAIVLDHVDAHAYDGDEEVRLASAGAMLERIALYARIEAQGGLGTIVPDANVNPQVARVLFILGDAFRQAWPPLPSEKLADGGSWQTEDTASDGPGRRSRIVLHDRGNGGYGLEVRTSLVRKGTDAELGNGRMEIELENGLVRSASVDYSRHDAVIVGGAAQQTVHATIRRKAADATAHTDVDK